MTTRPLLARLQRSWWFAWIIAAALGLSHFKDVADGYDALLVLIKVKPDALALAQTAEKGEFSRALTEAAWKRLFWARAFQARVGLKAPNPEVDEAWKKYIEASEVWATRIMVFIVTTEKFYGSTKSNELEGEVQFALKEMAAELIKLRYQANLDKDLPIAKQKIDDANSVLYRFVRGFDEKTK